jgi:hypothetical protein
MRRYLVIALAVALSVPALAAARPPRFTLGRGESVFWNGPHIESASGDTFEYLLEVEERGERLRIGFDHPEVEDGFDVEIDAPGGGGASFAVGPGIYSDEQVFEDPRAGTWRIRVTAREVTDSGFRLRAKLETQPPSLGTRRGDVLPNLQVLPPHEASFMVPLTNGAGDQAPTGVNVAGQGGCHPEEHVEDQAVRCLRFAFGVRNTGLGPLDLSHSGGTPLEHDLFQRIYREDFSYRTRPAGKAVLHKTHGHWHHADAVGLQLFRVTNPKRGALEPAGAKRTKGFAHRNELLRDWDRFYPTIEVIDFGLRPGWADIYEWDRPGNYIDFGVNGDGRYVIRMWADPVDGILESNERDNAGYTYLEVSGSEVKLLESGRGRDPWDRCKIVVGFGGHPDPKGPRRPSACPRDTT